ncbi:AAA domain-containing protein [Rhodococcus sp. SMB37]|uniref:DEAD/DEAH box helicase n=1 Tax=Rhodococcus sp. SMB37 TaxID=2512213 RepID=UPI001043717D|nr:AAA domain-containing protein [Rhodococcus sp. SMB37]TCN55888.1 AAA domain-containing protein [Rhodococcus sp. SMB37]
MDAEYHRQGGIIEFWRAVELFSPQQVPKVDKFDTLSPVEKVTPRDLLPWEHGHRLRISPRRAGYERQHIVYFGVYRIDDVWSAVDEILAPGEENYDPRPSGECALAALVVDKYGCVVSGSEVLSGLAWAAGRTCNPGPGSASWLHGLDDAQKLLTELLDDEQHINPRCGCRLPLDTERLSAIRRRIAALVGVNGMIDCAEIRVRSVEVKQSDGVDGTDFLNSFIAADLGMVAGRVAAGDIGTGLAHYLTEDAVLDTARRVDVSAVPAASFVACRPEAIPPGRWPGKPEHPLALGQQFAVNTIMDELHSNAGIFAVNGPPGTGKSTLLRDLVAAVVVERADRLAHLASPADAFTATPHRWKAGEYTRVVQRWTDAFHGFEIVVASSNNGAVENISFEMPAADAIHSDRFDTDYFADIATALLNDTGKDSKAWGLTAARLGRKSYRTGFTNTLWFDEKSSGKKATRRGLQSILKEFESAGPTRSWHDAVAEYRRARDAVAAMIDERQHGYERYRERAHRDSELRAVLDQVEAHTEALRSAAGIEVVQRGTVDRLQQGRATVENELAAHNEQRVAWWRMSRGAREERRLWQSHHTRLTDALAVWEEKYADAFAAHQHTMQKLVDLRGTHDQLAQRSDAVRYRRNELDCTLDELRQRWGGAMPGPEWADDPDRELAAPWSDMALNEARSRLFVAALALHKEFLAQVPKQMRQSMHGAMDVVAGNAPHDLDPAAVADAWRTLFFVVPLVSTTFASFDRVFRGLGREALGWLLIDEAGQATPQNPVGAIWRSRRTVVVGDPLQLEPVVTLPFRAQQAVRGAFGVDERWLPGRSSTQSIADRLTRWGTTLRGDDEPIWVGAPLRVHRRCAEPMFSVVNTIAYGGTMIHGGNPQPDGDLPPSQWYDVTGTSNGHFVQAEHDRLVELLEDLVSREHPMDDVIVLSPFRDVARRLAGLRSRYDGITAGTVHTAQGREAKVVVLVLGGDPAREGAKRWASSKPNLVNVAVSRAKQRLYVIGDRAAWSRHPRFDVLARELDRHAEWSR